MSVFILPLGVIFAAANPLPLDIESLRIVNYYHSEFYAGGDPPFTVSPRQVLRENVITGERVSTTLSGRNVVIEVCPFIRVAPDTSWRVPSTLQERLRSCEIHGAFDPRERQP